MSAMSRNSSSADPPAFRLLLRVRHPSIDPRELTTAFRTTPIHAFRAGDPCASAEVVSRRHVDSYWLAEVSSLTLLHGLETGIGLPMPPAADTAPRRGGSLAGQGAGSAIAMLVMRLLVPQATLLRRMREEQGEVTLRVELDAARPESIAIAPVILRYLAEFGVTLAIEFMEI